jgi:hypothetical protein
VSARTVLVFAIGIFFGGPLSFLWYVIEESYWWIPMAFITWLAAVLLPEWSARKTAPYRPHRHHRRRH